MSKEFRNNFSLYRAMKGPDFKGAAARLELSKDNEHLFLVLANQIAEQDNPRPYDWDNKLTVKLGQTDIGKMLDFLATAEPGAMLDLFHKNEKGNKVIKLSLGDRGFYIKVSAQEGGTQNSVGIPVSWDESRLLKLVLERAFTLMLGW
jgi:hypothetical protein